MNPTQSEKTALRQSMLSKRQSMSAKDRLEAAQSIKLQFSDHPYLAYANSFAGYYAIKSEPDVLPIFNHMQQYHKVMGLPAIDGDNLEFRQWQPGQALIDGAHAIKAPSPESLAFIPEVVLVPLLAFDARGFRLGYGGGYYDRVIKRLRETEQKAPLFIGVAYDMQEVGELPVEEHDQPLDGILTPQGVSMFTPLQNAAL